jgi:cytochrome b
MAKQETDKQVWDLGLRLFHWLLVIFFCISYLTREIEDSIHPYSGYLIIGLLCFRIVWGFVGGKHARFADFIYTPQQIINYAKGMLSGQLPEHEGHNPVASLMVFTLLASLIATTVTGLKVYGEEGHGPLAAQANIKVIADAKASSLHEIKVHDGEHHEHESEWEEIHEFFANFTVFLIMLHILGVIVSTYLEKQNLVMVMITGYKRPIDTEK